ncbi:MAG: adenosine deaminase [Francisella sp.]|jgi:adenosine deaminase
MIKDKIHKLPKVLLHDHLDGGLRVNTIIELAKADNVKLPYQDEANLQNWFYKEFSSKDFDKCFKSFDISGAVMQSAKNIERVAFESAEDHAKDNVIYAEARFCPYFHLSQGLNYNEIIESISSGFERAKEQYGIETGILICGMYHLDDATNLEMAKLCTKHKKIVGYYFAGMDIRGNLSSTQSKIIEFLNKNNIKFTAHSGEFSNIDNIIDAINNGAKRLGHACNLLKTEDENILEKTICLIKEKNIHIESNPSSNIALGIIDDFKNHPYKKMYDMEISIALNTDDRLMLKNLSLTDEYFNAHRENYLSLTDMVTMNINAANSAFTEPHLKQKIIKTIKDFDY